ncbi:2-C-methyl-D-erythritol 4-phosphate cytidylyltransferase [Labilibacter marinus]|uniref:2-C-methyl-D-erythritol 4-phosphate cytidylyltransferase n=1 Tax=Labilibacter marinus TaxID=1477105 RepID=UPI00094FEAE3|nr:2-C-methyl-D-erythritol 4-phosphate cytidylyltransferase [Labilibacter marinus]
MKKAVVIVAGGSGTRMKSDLPKQFIEWCGKPILMHTIERFYKYSEAMEIVLVLPKNQFTLWDELCQKYDFNIPLQLANGGATRFESVNNGLDILEEECLVGVHDGVRPLVSFNTLDNCYKTAEMEGSAIPVTEAFESIREVDDNMNKAVDRTRYKMVQTPQVFILSKLKEAYNQPFNSIFTDDASVYEYAGNKVFLTEGNRENIKITTPIDLLIGESLKDYLH